MEKFQNNYIVKKKPVKKKIHTGNSLAVHWLGPFTDKDEVSITGWETKILQSQKKKYIQSGSMYTKFFKNKN